MRPPSFTTWMLGNPLSVIVIAVGAVYLGVKWYTGEASGLLAFGGLVLTTMSVKAGETVSKYWLWKREWDALGGRQRRVPAASLLRGRPIAQFLAGLAAWAVAAFALIDQSDDPEIATLAPFFWLLSVAMIGAGLWTMIRRRRAARPVPNVAVKVCPGVPLRSPGPKRFYGALPEYCWRLFSAAPARTQTD